MMIGDKIKLLRSEKNMSQVELADQLNLTRQTVSKWENNRALPDVENIILLSKFFDYDFFEIAGDGFNEKDVMRHNKDVVRKSMIKKSALIIIGITL